MPEKKDVKPKIELLESASLYTAELCSPIKEKLAGIKVCSPNIVFKPCGPIGKLKCIPDLTGPVICVPSACLPGLICPPGGGCGPWVEGPIDYRTWIELPAIRINEIAAKVEELTTRVEALSKKIATR